MRSFRDGRLVSESSGGSSGNVFTRSWARISRRRRRSRPPPIEEIAELPELAEEPGPSTSPQQIPWRLANTPEKPKPLLNRGMDKLRRSIRKSFRKAPSLTAETATSSTGPVDDGTALKTPWALDEKSVRQGICKFNVKYLGCCEVYESRGVHVCEGALQHLKNRKRNTKAILYISGDGLRVVDRESNRGLIVDQTIEKVSFCAPDRHCEKGFAYICREGATRRWMCHGFLTTKESGERVSHAVGCAFTICLEQKKKREAELVAARGGSQQSTNNPAKYPDLNEVWNAPTPPPPESNGFAKNNPAYASFRRQLSITERKQDPQTAIVNDPPPCNSARSTINESMIKPRPQANPALFDRQGSFRAPAVPQQAFKRFSSLRTDLLSRPNLDSTRLLNTEPIYEGDEWPETSLSSNPLPVSTSLQFNHIAEGNKENGSGVSNWTGIFNPTCQTTPVHSGKIIPESKTSPSKADEWLEQTFKALSVKNDSPKLITSNSQLPNSQSIDLIDFSSGQSTIPPSTNSPSLPSRNLSSLPSRNLSSLPSTNTVNFPLTNAPSLSSTNSSSHPSTNSGTLPSMPSVPQSKPVMYDQVPGDHPVEVQKSHGRKSSSTKKIEYQLLEEIDAPVSPPRTTPAFGTSNVDVFGQPVFVPPTPRSGPSISDPFDVQWSTAVLKQTSNGTEPRYAVPPVNPFSSESAPVNV